ncbi:MAG: hypothetical protein CVU23_14045, partial [Betaproteobacteria bacterium HGW-Betaproteobacteria-17]
MDPKAFPNRPLGRESEAAGQMLKYWGKARPGGGTGADYHPLPYHSLDVAAVGEAYLTAHPRFLGFFAEALGLSPASTLRWLTFWLA